MIDSSINKLYHELKELDHDNLQDKSVVRSRLLDAFYNYQMGHCYKPITVYVPDSYSGYLVKRDVPCGSCYYCRNNHINEWVTRCYAHLQDFKNAYFITLTYSPYYDCNEPTSRYMLQYLEHALFVYDNFNENHRFGWNPCVLVKKHYQDFFKRLRRYTGLSDITYVVAGEYGSEFGRPHFHAIVFTNGVLTQNDIRRAWSVALVHHPDGSVSPKTNNKCPDFWHCSDRRTENYYWYRPIGRVDFHDLVANGTITQEKLLIDGRSMTGHDCFAYVCKYCNKKQFGNEARLKKAFDRLSEIYKLYKNEKSKFNLNSYLGNVDEVLRLSQEMEIFYKIPSFGLYLTSPYSLFQQVRPEICLDALDGYDCGNKSQIVLRDPILTYEPIYPCVYFDFVSQFGCFLSVSRGTPIGSLYCQTHLQEMVDGNYPQPPLQTTGFVVPKYFMEKVDEYIYGLRRIGAKGNAQKTNLSIMQRLFDYECDDDSILNYSISHTTSFTLSSLLNSSFCFVDKYTKERMLIWRTVRNSSYSFYVSSYSYDRSLKKYKFLRSRSLDEFVSYYKKQLADAFARHDDVQHQSMLNNLKRIYCDAYLNKILGHSLKDDPLSHFDSFCVDAIHRLEDNITHHKEEIKLHKQTDKQ